MLRIILLLFTVLTIGLAEKTNAQNSRETESRRAPIRVEQEQLPQKKISKRKAKKQMEKRYSAYFDRLVVEYEERMEANAKKNYQMAKELRKPQYSDPSYFGHKRPPKKRASGKKRKCKECHMWH